jgi:hypothetical protein
MMGRAGRGDRAGHAAVLLRPGDDWSAETLARALRDEQVPDLASHFERAPRAGWRSTAAQADVAAVATHVAAHLSRHHELGADAEALRAFFSRSLGGAAIAALLGPALTWLTDPAHALAFRDEHGRYRLTVLGLKATRATLPLPLAAGVAQLLRDLLSLDDADQLLDHWSPLDHLIVLTLLSRNAPTLRPFSGALAEQVDAWMERGPRGAPLLFREWIRGQQGFSRAAEVLGSLGVTPTGSTGDADERARKLAYVAVFHALILDQLAQGVPVVDVQRQWRVAGLVGVE